MTSYNHKPTGGENTKQATRKSLLLALIASFALIATGTFAFADDARIFIGDDDEGDHTNEAAITEEEAMAIAEEHTGGTAFSVELENEDGYLVCGIHVEEDDGSKCDVKVDAGTGEVLKVKSDDDD